MSGRVIVTLPHLEPWGTEAQTLLLTRALVAAGWSVRVCCFFGHDESVVAAFRRAGAAVVLFGLRRSDGLLRLFGRLKAECSAQRPEVLHVQYLTPGLPAVLAGRLAGVKRILTTVHHTGSDHGPREHALMRVGAALCSTVFCVSLAVEESWFGSGTIYTEHLASHPPRHCTLYNAIAPAPEAGSAGAGAASSPPLVTGLTPGAVVGIVGRLTPEKGHETLLAALPAIVARHPGAKVLIVGSGPEEERLRRLGAALGVEAAVFWLGRRPAAELAALRNLMDVAVVPSKHEGFGLVAAEASAAGLPVVATDVGGLREVVEHQVTGLLVPRGDTGALAGAISRLLGDAGLRRSLGTAGRRRVGERFSYERYARLIRSVYDPAGNPVER